MRQHESIGFSRAVDRGVASALQRLRSLGVSSAVDRGVASALQRLWDLAVSRAVDRGVASVMRQHEDSGAWGGDVSPATRVGASRMPRTINAGVLGVALGVVLLPTGLASAQFDGRWHPYYHDLLAVQSVNTGFGNSTLGDPQYANGSELDAAYSTGSNWIEGLVPILLTGNLAPADTLVLFIDADFGDFVGQNTITGGAGLPDSYLGLTFDEGFRATHYLIASGGGSPFAWQVHAGNLVVGAGGFVGGNDGQSGGVLSGGDYASSSIRSAIDNSNIDGVSGDVAEAVVDPLTAMSGMEFGISLEWLGLLDGYFRVTAFINSGRQDFASNQFLGSLPVFSGNLGGDGAGNPTGSLSGINLADIEGDQFFTVVFPSPGAISVLALAGLCGSRGRR